MTSTDQLRSVYMFVFTGFAVTVSEVADHFDLSKTTARRLLTRLANARLIDSFDVNEEAQGHSRRGQYKEVVWQCWQTYDDASEDDARATFDAAFPQEPNNTKEGDMPRNNANTRKASTKVNAKSQGFPSCYLGETGNFRPGMDARAKSDLRAAVAGKRTGKELHRFTKAGAQKLLTVRGW